jgi:hypothetical protein
VALAGLDLDHDGVIDSSDKIYNDLRLWQDRNHNGISEPAELSTLQAHGVLGLDVRFKSTRTTDEHENLSRAACTAAEKDANSKVPVGCYKRHCHCDCTKGNETATYEDDSMMGLRAR